MYIPSFPKYLSIYILTKSEFISSCSQPAVGSNIVQITHTTFFVNVKKNGCRQPFWISKNHFPSHFLPFQIDTTIFILWICLQNGCRRPFWMSEIHLWSHFSPFQIDRSSWMSEIHFRSHFWSFWMSKMAGGYFGWDDNVIYRTCPRYLDE